MIYLSHQFGGAANYEEFVHYQINLLFVPRRLENVFNCVRCCSAAAFFGFDTSIVSSILGPKTGFKKKWYRSFFVVFTCPLPVLDGFDWHNVSSLCPSTVLSSVVKNLNDIKRKNYWKSSKLNPGLPGEKQVCCLCAMQPHVYWWV